MEIIAKVYEIPSVKAKTRLKKLGLKLIPKKTYQRTWINLQTDRMTSPHPFSYLPDTAQIRDAQSPPVMQ